MNWGNRLLGLASALCTACVVGAWLSNRPVHAYQDTPATINNPFSDIADTYMFPSPTNQNNVVVVLDVHPLIPAGKGKSTFFNQGVLYTMKFDTKIGGTGHIPAENLVIQFSAGIASNGTQQIFVYGPSSPQQVGTTTKVQSQTGSGRINQSFTAANGLLTVFAGGRENPAFYNRQQLLQIIPNRNQGSNAPTCLPGGSGTCPRGFPNPGTDSQGGTNVLSFVVEMPRSELHSGLGNTRVAYWATTSSETGN
jgi:hypothetical protein